MRFLSDLGSVLGILSIVRPGDVPDLVTFEQMRDLFVDVARPEDVRLSESLAGAADDSFASVARSAAGVVEVSESTVLVPDDPDAFTPPGQRFHQEWFLIFCELDLRDLNNVNLAARFFRTALQKTPPPAWRVARVNSLEQRTSLAIGSSLSNIERMRTIVRLEVGVPHLGNMLTTADVQLIFDNLRSIRALKLLFCHLVPSYPRCDTLTSLSLWSMSVPIANISGAFPNLTDLVVAGLWSCEDDVKFGSDDSFCQFLLDLPRLQRLGIGDCKACPKLGLPVLLEMRLTHLWLQGRWQSDTNYPLALTPAKLDELVGSLMGRGLREFVTQVGSNHGEVKEAVFEGLRRRHGAKVVDADSLPWVYPKILGYSWRAQ